MKALIFEQKKVGASFVEQDIPAEYLDAAERAHDEPKPKHPDPADTQPLNRQEISTLRQQMADELSEFRASTPTPKKGSVDRQARAARLADQEARRRSQAKQRSEATQEIMNDIRSQLDEDD